MSPDNGLTDPTRSEFSELSRRQFLVRTMAGASGAAAILPGIVVLPAFAAERTSTTSVVANSADKPAEYVIKVIAQQAAPDGRRREVFCYDGKIPGPVIRAKEGQTFKIKVTNNLKVPTSIHWHGMHQRAHGRWMA